MIQNAIRTIRTFLPVAGSVTPQEIEDAVNIAVGIPQYAALDRNILIREIQSIYNIRMDDFRIIESYERRLPWLIAKKTEIWPQGKSTFWNRYRDYLQLKKTLHQMFWDV